MPATGPSAAPRDLVGLRAAIDALDHEILALLNERARRVEQVGALKRGSGEAPIYVASRERDLIAGLCAANPGPFPSDALPHVFREIISATRSLEEVVRVSFLGPAGTFSHQAVVRQFGAIVDLVPAASISEVFSLTERGRASYGIVPIENSIEGVVTETFDNLVEMEVTICGEVLLPVRQTLLSQSGRLEDVRKVASHPQPLAQCRQWLQNRLPKAALSQTASTAAAAELAAGDPEVAAIGSEVAAEVYDLQIIETGIEDSRRNTTRFLIIGREQPAASGHDLTSAVFTVQKDSSGALHRLLEPFAERGVNLSSIQSRPMKGKPWEYLFFIDLQGHSSSPAVQQALDAAAEVAHSYKVLGSFPRGGAVPRSGEDAP